MQKKSISEMYDIVRFDMLQKKLLATEPMTCGDIMLLWKVSSTTTQSTLTRLKKSGLLTFVRIDSKIAKWMLPEQEAEATKQRDKNRHVILERAKERNKDRNRLRRYGFDINDADIDMEISRKIATTWEPIKIKGPCSVFDLERFL